MVLLELWVVRGLQLHMKAQQPYPFPSGLARDAQGLLIQKLRVGTDGHPRVGTDVKMPHQDLIRAGRVGTDVKVLHQDLI